MRVVPVLGDMTRAGLGLSSNAFDELAERCDLVMHAAANVNFLFPYRALKATNVTAAVDMLRLAGTGRQKPFHFVSTIGIFLSPDHAGRVISEADPLEVLPERANGYSQTKWVAERMMMTARERGIPVTIHRPGFVGWHSRTGVMNDKDFVTGILDACLTLGRAPDVSMTLDVAPVDYVVRAMTWLATRVSSAGKTYHLNNPEPWTWRAVVDAFRAEGAMLEWVSYERWRTELSQRREPALHRFATMLPERVDEAGSIFAALSDVPTFQFDAVKSDLAGSGIGCGGLDRALVAAFLRNPGSGHRVPRAESSTQLIRAADAISKAG
jgi:thioester reductase-like protein